MRSAKPGSDSPIAMTTETRMSAALSMQRLRRGVQRKALQRLADVVDVVDLAAEHAEASVMAGVLLEQDRPPVVDLVRQQHGLDLEQAVDRRAPGEGRQVARRVAQHRSGA